MNNRKPIKGQSRQNLNREEPGDVVSALFNSWILGYDIDDCLVDADERGIELGMVLGRMLRDGAPFVINKNTGSLTYSTKSNHIIDFPFEQAQFGPGGRSAVAIRELLYNMKICSVCPYNNGEAK